MASPTTSKLLLKGGTMLLHDAHLHVVPTRSDLLIEGNTISKIANNIDSGLENTRVIDCSGKIISPGFISTHNHLYQTQLKGRHANDTLLEYFPKGNFVVCFYDVEDAFWGQLAGAMEAIDAGTTTVVDHSRLNLSPEYPKTAIQALVTSGLRAVYCYCAPRNVRSWKPFEWDDGDSAAPWALDTLKSLARQAPFAGRVHVGFANDNVFMDPGALQSLYAALRSAPTKLITTHAVGGAMFGNPPSALAMLQRAGVLADDVLVSHMSWAKAEDAELLAASGASVSSTPATEMQMGYPSVALLCGGDGGDGETRPYAAHASVGVDCHSWGTGYIPGQARLALQAARSARGHALEARHGGQWSRIVEPRVEEAFNLATIAGAKAAKLENEVGRLAEGMRADVVVFSTDSPAMVAAAEENPVAAVIQHSSERDVETVIVDGIIRKEQGRLTDVTIAEEIDGAQGLGLSGKKLSWKDVAAALLESRLRLNERINGVDMKAAEEGAIDAFYMNRERLLEQH